MMKHAMKTVVVLATSAVAIPYTMALIANMMYGWPLGKDKYKRALHPRKVYALNYAILQMIKTNLRYSGLYLQWKLFYTTAEKDRVMKDLPYGSHDNSLDLYFPLDAMGHQVRGSKPVIMFFYGGTWGSGDKDMYGMMCAELADKTRSLVCCPNYSIYPKGYVDDMVQDVVDCINWVHHNIEDFDGDKNRLCLIGHSAGAHLVVMATLQLTIRRLLRDPSSAIMSVTELSGIPLSRQSSNFSESIRFDEGHFNGGAQHEPSNEHGAVLGESTTAAGSFYVVEGEEKILSGEDMKAEAKENNASFIMLDDTNNDSDNGEGASAEEVEGMAATTSDEGDLEKSETEATKEEVVRDDVQSLLLQASTRSISEVEDKDTSTDTPPPAVIVREASDMSPSQREAHDLLSSLKLVIGLAGVYHIGEHYEFEAWRGVEDVSTMGKAMYGPEHFERCSPSYLVRDLPHNTRIPPTLLLHGDSDNTVPLTSSLHFAQALCDLGSRSVHLVTLPGCGHTEICLDLMHPSRQWYDSVMGEVLRGTNLYL